MSTRPTRTEAAAYYFTYIDQVAMAKNHASDACQYVCDQAVQLHGGYGYMREYVVERLYRDARILPIGGGTTEIMRELISLRRARGPA